MIKAYIQSFLAFAKSVFSDGGAGSLSRCGSGFILVSTVGWVSYLVIKNGTMPDLTGPAIFMTAGVGSLYGTNKLPEMLSAARGK
jgi:hypothetical protein